MSDSLRAQLEIKLAATLTNTLGGGLGDVVADIAASYKSGIITDGTIVDTADKVWASKGRTLANAGTETIDLVAFTGIDIGTGAGEDPCGNGLTLVEICALLILRDDASAGTLTLGGAASNEFTSMWAAGDAPVILPKGFLFIGSMKDPAYVVGSTNKNLKILSSGASTYDIYVIGRSA